MRVVDKTYCWLVVANLLVFFHRQLNFPSVVVVVVVSDILKFFAIDLFIEESGSSLSAASSLLSK
jgi:hypothetical protein